MSKKMQITLTIACLLMVLVITGCSEETTNFVEPVDPGSPVQELVAGFSASFTPTAAADDGICRLLLTSSVTGGESPFTYDWSAPALANAATTRSGYPDGADVSLTLPDTYGASGGDPALIRLVVRDASGMSDDSAAAEALDCTGSQAVSFVGD